MLNRIMNKKRLLTLFAGLTLAILLLVPVLVNAVEFGGGGDGKIEFVNPLLAKSLIELMGLVVGVMLYFAIPVAAVYFLWAAVGLIQAASKGESSKITEKKKALLYALVGIFLLASFTGILRLVTNLLIDSESELGKGIEENLDELEGAIDTGVIENTGQKVPGE